MQETQTAPQMKNGVNVTQLLDTIEAIGRDPELARFEFRATNRWLEGTRNEATIGGYFGVREEAARAAPFRFLADEPPVLCGRDQGANPVEYLIAALSMCVTTTVVAHAAARGYDIEEVSSELSGDLDVRGFLAMSQDVRPGYQRIRFVMTAKTQAPRDVLEQLARLSPVYDVVARSVPVELVIETY